MNNTHKWTLWQAKFAFRYVRCRKIEIVGNNTVQSENAVFEVEIRGWCRRDLVRLRKITTQFFSKFLTNNANSAILFLLRVFCVLCNSAW